MSGMKNISKHGDEYELGVTPDQESLLSFRVLILTKR